MKRFIYLSAVFAAMLLMVSCSGSNSTPSAAFENYSSGMVSGDYDKLTSGIYISDENKEKADAIRESYKEMLESKGKSSLDKKGGLKEIVVLSEEISEDGNTAVVKFKQVFGDGSETEDDQKMVKVGDEWLMDIGK